MGAILKHGDSCPCCGRPIKTEGTDMLLVLSWFAWMKDGRPKLPGQKGAAA